MFASSGNIQKASPSPRHTLILMHSNPCKNGVKGDGEEVAECTIFLLYPIPLKPWAYYIGLDSSSTRLGKWRESLHKNRDSFSIQMKESSFACSVISGKCDRYLNASSNLYPLMQPSSTASWIPVCNSIPLPFLKCLLPMHSDEHHGNQDEPGWSASGDKLSEIFSTNPARKFSNCPAWLPPTTVIPVFGFSWPKATKQGPHMALGGELPVGLLNGSCCPLADNLNREYPNPVFLWDWEADSCGSSARWPFSVFASTGDLKAWMCLLPIAYQSDTNDYCSREGFNVYHLEESSFIYFLFPFFDLFYSTLSLSKGKSMSI